MWKPWWVQRAEGGLCGHTQSTLGPRLQLWPASSAAQGAGGAPWAGFDGVPLPAGGRGRVALPDPLHHGGRDHEVLPDRQPHVHQHRASFSTTARHTCAAPSSSLRLTDPCPTLTRTSPSRMYARALGALVGNASLLRGLARVRTRLSPGPPGSLSSPGRPRSRSLLSVPPASPLRLAPFLSSSLFSESRGLGLDFSETNSDLVLPLSTVRAHSC